ncbi:MAG: hypothetical protein ABI331_05585 [Gemmatimonadaceae bacterium]
MITDYAASSYAIRPNVVLKMPGQASVSVSTARLAAGVLMTNFC